MTSGVYTRTDEMRRNISAAKRKNPNRYWLGKKRPDISEGQRGDNNPMWGKHLTEEHKKKISEKHKGRKNHWLAREKSPFWKDGRAMDRKAYRKRHWEENKEAYNFSAKKRSRGKKATSTSHTLEAWQQLKAEHNYKCLRCKKKEPEIKLTEDHIVPLSKGGSDLISNIQPLCRSCNSKKNTLVIDYARLNSMTIYA